MTVGINSYNKRDVLIGILRRLPDLMIEFHIDKHSNIREPQNIRSIIHNKDRIIIYITDKEQSEY